MMGILLLMPDACTTCMDNREDRNEMKWDFFVDKTMRSPFLIFEDAMDGKHECFQADRDYMISWSSFSFSHNNRKFNGLMPLISLEVQSLLQPLSRSKSKIWRWTPCLSNWRESWREHSPSESDKKTILDATLIDTIRLHDLMKWPDNPDGKSSSDCLLSFYQFSIREDHQERGSTLVSLIYSV